MNYTTWGYGYEHNWPGQMDAEDIYNCIFGQAVSIPYWQDGRHPMPPMGWMQVDWIVLGQAFNRWPRGIRQWLSKHMSPFSVTGRVMCLWKEYEHSRCPRCNATNENIDCIRVCPAPTLFGLTVCNCN
jgi:hypothetical protein